MNASADVALHAAARLRRFLLTDAVQLRDGPQAGAIVGAFDGRGLARYVYPEITGYYLHWLAEVCALDAGAAMRAQAAADWATRTLVRGAMPATRTYLLAGEPPDWRNEAVFFFDLGMLVGGLWAAHERGLIDVPAFAAECLLDELARFVDAEGRLVAARRNDGAPALPVRWSTTGGPFELKAAARVGLAGRRWHVRDELVRACDALRDATVPTAAETTLGMFHPTLYFAEGILVTDPTSAADVSRLLARMLACRGVDGSLPEAENSGVPRSDVVAQALRIGVLLRHRDVEGAPSIEDMAALAHVLCARILPGGAMPFRADIEHPQPNVWCSMFAEQALRWFGDHAQGRAVPGAEWLV